MIAYVLSRTDPAKCLSYIAAGNGEATFSESDRAHGIFANAQDRFDLLEEAHKWLAVQG